MKDTIWAPISAIAIGTVLGTAAVWGVENLVVRHYKQIDRLNAEQCITHAWQGADPELMAAWCRANGHRTQPRRFVTTSALKAF